MRDSHNILSFQRENNAAAEREGGRMRKRKGRGDGQKKVKKGKGDIEEKGEGETDSKADMNMCSVTRL